MMICAAILVLVAFTIAIGIIPAVGSDPQSGSKNNQVVIVLIFMTILILLTALILFSFATQSKGKNRGSIVASLLTVGIIHILLGFTLFDGGVAIRDHGASLQIPSTLLLIGALLIILVGLASIAVIYIFPKELERSTQTEQ